MNSPPTMDMNHIPVDLFWHIYIDQQNIERGIQIIQRQFEKIKKSELIDRVRVVNIVFVGNVPFPCEDIRQHPKVRILATIGRGYEGVTSYCIKRTCDTQKHESLIVYLHNRGMSHPSDSPSEDWTLMMEYFVIERWKQCLQILTNKYTCGCELWAHTDRMNPSDFIYHYSGNFWWSRSEYIKKINPPVFGDRHVESEDWILQLVDHGIPKEHFGILHRTNDRYKRGVVHSYIDRYPFHYYASGNETPDVELDRTLFNGEDCYPVKEYDFAIVYCGLTRSVKKTHESHQKYLFDVLRHHQLSYKTFMHTWKTKEDTQYVWETIVPQKIDYSEYKLLSPHEYVLDDQDAFLDTINMDHYFYQHVWNTQGHCGEGEWLPRLVTNHLCMLESQKRGLHMVEKDMSKGNKYKFIMYIRPDLTLWNELPVHPIMTNADKIIIPNHSHHEGFNDQFAVMNYDYAKLYGNKITEIAEFRKKHGRIVSEKYCKYIITKYRIPVHEIDFKYELTRP